MMDELIGAVECTKIWTYLLYMYIFLLNSLREMDKVNLSNRKKNHTSEKKLYR